MNLKNCPHCGKVFADNSSHKICPTCRQQEEENFMKVKEYLWDNPGATIDEVSQETGVERELIVKFVKEDRLSAEGIDFDFSLECERCGISITHGHYCKKCQQKLVEGFSGSDQKQKQQGKQQKKESGRMYLEHRIRRHDKGD